MMRHHHAARGVATVAHPNEGEGIVFQLTTLEGLAIELISNDRAHLGGDDASKSLAILSLRELHGVVRGQD